MLTSASYICLDGEGLCKKLAVSGYAVADVLAREQNKKAKRRRV